MQEINLLQNKVKDRTLQFERSNRFVLIIFGLILVFEIVLVAGLYALAQSTSKQSEAIKVSNAKIQKSMSENQKDLKNAQGLQAQLKNVTTLLQNHVYWTAFLDKVSAITPGKVQFKSITGSTSDGKLHVEAMAASYQDIGRLLLSLGTSDKFQDVKLRSVAPSQDGVFGYSFSLDMAVVPTIFKNTK